MDFTLKKIAELAQINVSSARFYKDKFFKYLTTSGEGRTMKYEEKSSVAIFTLIAESYKQGLDYDQIVELLEQGYGVPTDIVPVVKENLTTQSDIIEGIREMLKDELSKRDEAIDKLSQQVESLAQGSEERDLRLMENIRLLQAQQQRKWWHIFKK